MSMIGYFIKIQMKQFTKLRFVFYFNRLRYVI